MDASRGIKLYFLLLALMVMSTVVFLEVYHNELQWDFVAHHHVRNVSMDSADIQPEGLNVSQRSNQAEASANPLLTLFTTFKNSHEHLHIYMNTLHNWAILMPHDVPVLFVYDTDPKLVENATL